MSAPTGGGYRNVAVFLAILLTAAEQIDAQAFLLTYSDEQVGTKISQKTLEINGTNITELYTVTTSSRVPSEFSQTTMDAITVVWYVSTFLALMAFFFLMACSDRKCGRQDPTPPLDDPSQSLPPPTPAPSYSEFAPPSYDTVMKKDTNSSSVFVVQVPYVESEKDRDVLPNIKFHTVDELQKLSS